MKAYPIKSCSECPNWDYDKGSNLYYEKRFSVKEEKEYFFDLVSEYKDIDGDMFIVYKFNRDDIEIVVWFLEMLWSISKTFDLRILIDLSEDDKIQILLRTDNVHWKLHE